MHRRTIFLGIIVSFILQLYAPSICAQTPSSDSLEMTTSFWGTAYRMGDRTVTGGELDRIIRAVNDTLLLTSYKRSRDYSVLSFICEFAGGFTIGYGAFSDEPKGARNLAGAGLILLGIFLDGMSDTRMREAIDRYNELKAPRAQLDRSPKGQEFSLAVRIVF